MPHLLLRLLAILSVAGGLAGCSDSSGPNEPAPPTQLKVMSYNLRYADAGILVEEQSRRQELVSSVIGHNPDVLAVQEANEPWMEALPTDLTDYDFVGVGRDDGDSAGERAAIFFRKERFQVLDSGNFWLSDTPQIPSYGWGAQHRRICTWVALTDTTTGQVFSVFNTHLDHEVEEARSRGMALIMEHIGRSPYPVILTGDFNLLEGSPLYLEIENSMLADTKHSAAETMNHGTINWFMPIDTGVVIDYIFAQEDAFRALRYIVDPSALYNELPVSDHYPVIAELELLF